MASTRRETTPRQTAVGCSSTWKPTPSSWPVSWPIPRAAICLALAGGEARPAGELAARAGVSAQTASNHLAKLIAGRILRVEQQGRWRYYRLAGAEVGHVVEALAVVAPRLPDAPVGGDGMTDVARRLRDARTSIATWRAGWASRSPTR